jgi:hypothetical protein
VSPPTTEALSPDAEALVAIGAFTLFTDPEGPHDGIPAKGK